MTDDWIFYVSGQVAAIASEVSELPRHKTRGKEASVLLNTLYVSENNSALSEGLHAGMSACMCVCVYTFVVVLSNMQSLLCGEDPSFLLNVSGHHPGLHPFLSASLGLVLLYLFSS